MQFSATLLGGLISACVAFLTLRGTLGNQLRLEEQRFEYQRKIDHEDREHKASAFRRRVLRDLKRLHNTAGLQSSARTRLSAWKDMTTTLEAVLETEECPRSLDDAQYDAAWSACEESQAAMMFLQIWAMNKANVRPDIVLLSFKLYCDALQECFRLFGDGDRVKALESTPRTFKGVGVWMTEDFNQDALYPNP